MKFILSLGRENMSANVFEIAVVEFLDNFLRGEGTQSSHYQAVGEDSLDIGDCRDVGDVIGAEECAIDVFPLDVTIWL